MAKLYQLPDVARGDALYEVLRRLRSAVETDVGHTPSAPVRIQFC